MRWSEAFIPTLREDPKDAEAVSHKLMLRAGLIRRLGSGAYSYLPLGQRALLRAIAIVREEMNRAGGQECLLPAMHPLELWQQTGRDKLMGEVLIRFKDRTGKDMVLGPTHEEVITSLVAEVKSHKQLPLLLYQIQTKFRDEPRPRSGIIRSKEFLMKDAYSFHTDLADLDRTYQRMVETYRRIFARCGLQVIACEADSGVMGGSQSMEFMAPADSGEDHVAQCAACGYAANLEAAVAQQPADKPPAAASAPAAEAVATPGKHTVEQVSAFLGVTPQALIKTMIYETATEPVAVLVRGDHEVNEAKLARALSVPQFRLANAATITRLTGAPVGFAGPIGLGATRIIADHAVMRMTEAITGGNKAETHMRHVVPGRDFTPASVADVRLVVAGDPCGKCGKPLTFVRTIEVGHVFKLGTKYSQALGAAVQDPTSGKQQPMIMGCYGIGVNRLLATAIEQRHDANGITWPPALAPFDVVVSLLETGNPEADRARKGEEVATRVGATAKQTAEAIAAKLQAAGREVLLDDREQSPGSKLKDADLIGIPVQVVVGRGWLNEQKVEVVERASKQRVSVDPNSVVEAADKLLDKVLGPD